jgi:uncharacterized tellurite resistance protein B-like protein
LVHSSNNRSKKNMENKLTLSDYQATMLAILIAADQELTESELFTAAAIFGETFGLTPEEALGRIQNASGRLAPLDAAGLDGVLNETTAVLKENLEMQYRHIMYLMLEKVALSDGLAAREEELLSWIHSAWEIPGEIISSIDPVVGADAIPVPTIQVVRELLATAVAGAHLRVLAARQGASLGDAERRQIDNAFWKVVDSIFALASVGGEGQPIASDAPVYCAGFGSIFRAKESLSNEPEAASFLQLRCDLSILFPDEPLPYVPGEGTEDFENHLNKIIEKKRAELGPQWRVEMLSPIQRVGKESAPVSRSARLAKSAPKKSSGCAVFLISGIGFISSFIV